MKPCPSRNCLALRKSTHVIFDLDGTLLDTEIVNRTAISDIAKRYGKEYTHEIQAKIIGTVEKESSRIAVTEMGLPMTVEDFQLEYRTNVNKQFQQGVPLMPGAEKIIRHLHRHNIPMAVATSSSKEAVTLKTAAHKELFCLFSHIVCGGDDAEVKEGKPKPDIFLVCASRFSDKPSPDKCLVIEDAPNGIKAALAAGMQAILVPDEHLPMDLRRDAQLVVKALNMIPLNLFDLPPMMG